MFFHPCKLNYQFQDSHIEVTKSIFRCWDPKRGQHLKSGRSPRGSTSRRPSYLLCYTLLHFLEVGIGNIVIAIIALALAIVSTAHVWTSLSCIATRLGVHLGTHLLH